MRTIWVWHNLHYSDFILPFVGQQWSKHYGTSILPTKQKSNLVCFYFVYSGEKCIVSTVQKVGRDHLHLDWLICMHIFPRLQGSSSGFWWMFIKIVILVHFNICFNYIEPLIFMSSSVRAGMYILVYTFLVWAELYCLCQNVFHNDEWSIEFTRP